MSDWADNPRLNTWLAAQQAAFPAWSRETRQDWDFTVDSLDRLERLLRERFAGRAELVAAEESGRPEVLVPGWYLGEVLNRNYGTAWHRNPVEPTHPDQPKTPFVQLPEEPGAEYEDEDDIPPVCNPFTEIRGLFVRGPDDHLRDAVIRYER
ncbi:hypothetical protein ACFQFC_11055 [Amorphoplanes digitatis]|uniref:Uncharacterized protein n=1 Tax=Actinoplanes digitatis TaxID=1868 RepID=A0A7W7MRX5_9ACTN|nr:hypothetical protein [Actinoplanes digitatis]MBB4764736.1 hypothetical protein [Actinoplanes digitatis]BFE74292.1 hypothetical protein GCM10020092_075930 [Actinoplanes digitatis]GID91311.1 hypothetical protein Adi01nite_07230 [Actinoplanes digitatis]